MKGMAEHEAGRGAGQMSVAGWAQRVCGPGAALASFPGPRAFSSSWGPAALRPGGWGVSSDGEFPATGSPESRDSGRPCHLRVPSWVRPLPAWDLAWLLFVLGSSGLPGAWC